MISKVITMRANVIFIPLAATSFPTLWDAWQWNSTALLKAGVPVGRRSQYESIWVYDEDHMICVKGTSDQLARIEPISWVRFNEKTFNRRICEEINRQLRADFAGRTVTL